MPKERRIIPILISTAIFILMEIAALNMISANGQLQRHWIARGAHRIQGTLWGGTEGIKYYFQLKKVNRDLAAENADLREDLAYYKAIVDDARLDTLRLGFKPGRGFIYIPAEIEKISRNRQHNYIIINRGSEDGVLENSGIVTSKGVVGIIDAVEKHHSYALSFMNPDISISARLGDKGAVGPLVWDGRSSRRAILKEIPLQYKYQEGDTVYTSGYSAIFPPDIPLGTAGASKVINGATNEIKVRLFQDFSTLRYVTVVGNTSLSCRSARGIRRPWRRYPIEQHGVVAVQDCRAVCVGSTGNCGALDIRTFVHRRKIHRVGDVPIASQSDGCAVLPVLRIDGRSGGGTTHGIGNAVLVG